MESPATTRLSSKGQVVIPEEIRSRLGLREGTQFVVVGDRDVVILKTIAPPAMAEFDELDVLLDVALPPAPAVAVAVPSLEVAATESPPSASLSAFCAVSLS